MDSTLVAVTLLAIAMALIMSVTVWRLIRDERRRSAARVAALVAEMGAAEPAARPDFRTGQAAEREPSMRSGQSGSVIFGAAEEADTPGTLHDDMFAAGARPSSWQRRLTGVTAVGVIFVGVAGTAIFTIERDTNRPAASASAARTPAPAPLELVSLRHARQNSTLTITGLVRNPVGSTEIKRVTAVVFVFDRTGAFLTSGRAPLDFTSLAPGDESPFVVSIPDTGSVGRYRVSFRNEDGGVMPHVDRREPGGRQSTIGSAQTEPQSTVGVAAGLPVGVAAGLPVGVAAGLQARAAAVGGRQPR